ncbi:hypothetical protein ASZ78_004862 [Callipepla squamata]|uniref:carbonic anhydrase n=1 Tax=Callipepla squamata TaxID=9009 RepID=A0A226NPU4_CALSU|nr:hypothetical protein ASZ78_004862 [Callipepla squamata]
MAQSVWGYDSENGPERWHENYPMAKGDKQSPIEINSKDVRHDSSLSSWHASYDPGAAKTILNNGKTCRVVFDDTFDRSDSMHYHIQSKLQTPFVTLVVNITVVLNKVGKTPKPEMKRILEEIDNIKTKGKEAPFHHFDPSILFPKSRDYWTYHGSFTTPPCEECITWILLREPIEVSPDQMARLRSLSKNGENEPMCPLVDNWRPLQPVKGRIVRASFK